MRAAVIGAGAWGTALADLLARNGGAVTLWAYEADVSETVRKRHENTRFLPGVRLHPELDATSDLSDAYRGAELVVLVAPSHVLRTVARQSVPFVEPAATLVVATKGIERGSLAIMTDVVASEMPGHAVVALSGPSFASEVAARQPTAVVAASRDDPALAEVQQVFSNDHFRVYTESDVIGVELGGALKNVIALATGIAEGLGLGNNSRAALITRGLAELTRLGTAIGAVPQTFAGLAGVGDLVLTCTGGLSRNRSVGLEIGRGRALPEVLAGRDTVAEGIVTTESAHDLAQREGVSMPIVSTVHRILFDGYSARDAIAELMTRDLRAERDE